MVHIDIIFDMIHLEINFGGLGQTLEIHGSELKNKIFVAHLLLEAIKY